MIMVVLCSSCVIRVLTGRYSSLFKQPMVVNRNFNNLSLKDPALLDLKNLRNINALGLLKLLHTTESHRTFWEKDPKSGYTSTVKIPPTTQLIRDGFKELKTEIKIWKKEVTKKLESDPVVIFRPDELDICWQFGLPEVLSKWVTTSDKDHNQGFSTCELTTSTAGKGLFQGNLCVEPPQDGKVKKAGYCNMRTIRPKKSFKRDSFHDWTMYTHLVMRVRGDGRPYILNIATSGYFDQFWNDVYTYALYTRGGPYWQVSKIPFSKFFLTSKGRIQDKQCPLALDHVTHFGITMTDKVNGPFRLEIDYIGLEYDPGHFETFAYEMYQVPKYVAAT